MRQFDDIDQKFDTLRDHVAEERSMIENLACDVQELREDKELLLKVLGLSETEFEINRAKLELTNDVKSIKGE